MITVFMFWMFKPLRPLLGKVVKTMAGWMDVQSNFWKYWEKLLVVVEVLVLVLIVLMDVLKQCKANTVKL